MTDTQAYEIISEYPDLINYVDILFNRNEINTAQLIEQWKQAQQIVLQRRLEAIEKDKPGLSEIEVASMVTKLMEKHPQLTIKELRELSEMKDLMPYLEKYGYTNPKEKP